MRVIDFVPDKNKENKNKLFLEVEYMDGDADRFFTDEMDLEIKFMNWDTPKNLEKLNDILDNWIFLIKQLDKNENYQPPDEEEKGYNETLEMLYDEIPGDATCDGCRRSAIIDWELVGYDQEGKKYVAKIKSKK